MEGELAYLLIGLAAFVAGAVNALAGGGTLITFPILTAVGLSAVTANVTNAVALCPGYFGGTWAQRKDLRGQGARLKLLLPLGVAGGLLGAWLLLLSGEKLFRALVPWLILLASLLLALQEPMKKFIGRWRQEGDHRAAAALPLTLGAVYGGYFGAGLGVVMLATLGLTLDDNLNRLNALKQALSFVINVAAALFFLGSGHVHWPTAGVMAVCALVGGVAGGKLAGRIAPARLRQVVVAVGISVGLFYLSR